MMAPDLGTVLNAMAPLFKNRKRGHRQNKGLVEAEARVVSIYSKAVVYSKIAVCYIDLCLPFPAEGFSNPCPFLINRDRRSVFF